MSLERHADAPSARADLHGRDRELREVVRVLSSPPSLVIVEGEAGSGKSRLVLEALRDPAFGERRVLIGNCTAVGEPAPLEPLADALRGLEGERLAAPASPVCGVLRPMLPELADVLPEVEERTRDPAILRQLVQRAVRELLGVAGDVLLVLEDLQGADGRTREVLAGLVARPPARLAIVVTFRREEMPAGSPMLEALAHPPPSLSVARLALGPLARSAVARVLAEGLGREPPSRFVRWVLDVTGGLPFAVQEVVQGLRGRPEQLGDLFAAPERPFSEVPIAARDSLFDVAPVAVRDSVAGRLARLSASGRRLVEAASIPEPPVERALLRSVSGLAPPAYRQGMGEVVRAGLLEEVGGDRVQFRLPIIRVAVHRDLAPARHRLLHLRAARALARLNLRGPASVAYHFREAGADAQWIRWAERAADRAVSVGDDRSAAGILDEVLGAADLPRSTRDRLSMKFARAALYGLPFTESVPLVRGIFHREPLAPGIRGELRLAVARLLLEAGDARGARQEAERAVEDLRRRPEVAAEAHALLASPWVDVGSLADHLRAEQRARELLQVVTDPSRRARVEVDLIDAAVLRGDLRPLDALAVAEWARGSIEGSREHARALTNVGLALILLGHYEPAERHLKAALGLAEEPELERFVPYLFANQLLLDFWIGRWTDLEARAEALAPAVDLHPHARNKAMLVRGLLAVLSGSVGRGEALLESVASAAVLNGAIPIACTAFSALTWVRLVRGHPGGALEMSELGVDLLRSKGIWAWGGEIVPSAVSAMLSVEARVDALRLTGQLEEGIEGLAAPTARAGLLVARALLEEDRERAEDRWGRAAAAWAEIPRPHAAAWARERLAKLVLERDADLGRHLLAEVMEAYDGLGASWEADRIRRDLRRSGAPAPRPWRGGRRGYGGELSPREREVAALVAEGMTNREIAEALYLSPRTVAHHVSNAMQKLHVPSRAALAAAVAGKK